MTRFNKGFETSIVLIIAVSFLATGTVYAVAIPKRYSLRKPLIAAEKKDQNRLASTAVLLKLRQDLIDKRFLVEHFDNYATTIRSTVNPRLDTYVVAVGGTGPNISAPLLDTFFTKAYFIDTIEFSVDKLKKWHEPNNWHLYNATSKNAYFGYKRSTGLIGTVTFEENPEERFILELKALGVNREDVKIDTDDKDRPVVEFKLPGDNKIRKIVFIHQDLLNLDKKLHSELKGRIDAYHQKGVLMVTNSYGKYLSSISEWIKPGGFLILNNYDTDSKFKNPYPYISNQFMRYSDKLESLSSEMEKFLVFKYGWKMSLYRKVQSSTEEMISSLEQKHSLASNETILSSKGESFDDIWEWIHKRKLTQGEGIRDPRGLPIHPEEKAFAQAYSKMSLMKGLQDVLVSLIEAGTIEGCKWMLKTEYPLQTFVNSLNTIDYDIIIQRIKIAESRIQNIKINIAKSKIKRDYHKKKKSLDEQLLNSYRYRAFLRELTNRWRKPEEDTSLGIISKPSPVDTSL